MARKLLSEIFEHNKKLKTNAEKTEWFRANASKPLFYLLWLAFSDKVEWLLPDGAPPFTAWEDDRPGGKHPNRPGSEPSDLLRELRRMYLFLKGTGDHMPRIRREKLFQEVLEGI